MRFLASLAFLLMGSLSMLAQDTEYKAGHEGWLVDVDEAYELHKKTGKPIMANFTGSDWCGWCKRLSANVFVHDEFKEWAEDNVILLELDFPRRKQIPNEYRQQNANLQRAFKVRGFPTVWVFELDKDTKTGELKINALGKTGYQRSVAEFTNGVDKILAQAEKQGS
jgi:protein disulfide-isomerase